MNSNSDIDSFSDYRLFLRDRIAIKPGLSYRALAAAAGFSAKSFLKHVASGERHLSVDSAPKVAKALGLGPRESRVFEQLVRFARGSSDADKLEAWRGVQRERRAPSSRLERDQFEAYTRWYPLVLRELVGTLGFRDDASWLARRLRPKVSASMARAAMRLLERVGLVSRDAEGALQQQHVSLETGPIVKSLSVRAFHSKMLELARAALEELPKDERNVTSLMLPLTRDEYEEVTAKVRAFRKSLLAWWETQHSAPRERCEEEEVYQVMVTVVPMTQPVRA